MLRAHVSRSVFILLLAIPVRLPPRGAIEEYADWHLPVPAGLWRVVDDSCQPNDPACRKTYETRCSLRLAPDDGASPSKPVLSAAEGEVFFVGLRTGLGLTVILRHPDGRATSYSNLSRAVVTSGDVVTTGALLGYFGDNNSRDPHLRFSIFPDVVQRRCLEPLGLDGLSPEAIKVRSHNLPLGEVKLIHPEAELIFSIPPLVVSRIGQVVPVNLVMESGVTFKIHVLLTDEAKRLRRFGVVLGGRDILWATSPQATPDGNLSIVSVKVLGGPGRVTWELATGEAMADPAFTLAYDVDVPRVGSYGVILDNPDLVSPSSFSRHPQPPELCWHEVFLDSGLYPVQYRVILSGPAQVDSGWLDRNDSIDCWSPTGLQAGLYHWKVFVRDRAGHLNRTHDFPWAFIVQK